MWVPLYCAIATAGWTYLSPLSSLHVSPHIFTVILFATGLVPSLIFSELILRFACWRQVLRCASRVGGDLTAELAYGNNLFVVPHVADVHQTIFSYCVHGRALVFDLRCVSNILGLRLSSQTYISYHPRSHVCARGRPV